MTLHDEMQSALNAVHQAVQGVSVTLHGPNCDDVTVTAVYVRPVEGLRRDEAAGIDVQRARAVGIDATDIAHANDWEQMTLDGETWDIVFPATSESPAIIVFQVERVGAVQRGPSGRRVR